MERHSQTAGRGRGYPQEQALSPRGQSWAHSGLLLLPAVISLPTTYRGLVRGLCGNYDKDEANEFMLPSGVVTSNVNDFGKSWEVKVMHAFFRFPR